MKKINIIDLIIIFFIIAGIIVIGMKIGTFNFSNSPQIDNQIKEASIVIKVEDIRKNTFDSIKVSDIILSDETNIAVGIVDKIEVYPFEKRMEKENGEIVYPEYPDKYTMLITVKASLLEKETGYYVDGITEIKVNSDFKFYTKYVITTGKIEEISWEWKKYCNV